jgi:Family of unknown function (DUF6221)
MSDGELVAWLRRVITADLSDWRDREAHFLSVAEREGEYHYFEAREQVARCEAELAILDEHQPASVPQMAWRGCGTCKDPSGWPAMFPCRTVRLLASGYRNRPGYREAWKP